MLSKTDIKMHLLVNKGPYCYQNARYNDKNKESKFMFWFSL
jgi:hypothetical protein